MLGVKEEEEISVLFVVGEISFFFDFDRGNSFWMLEERVRELVNEVIYVV